MENYKVYQIFIASPGDVAEERRRLVRCVREVNNYVKSLNVQLHICGGHDAVPGAGRPQELINEQLLKSCDVFIGILWHRFGTPPGGRDPRTGREYMSGTEEEFRTAYDSWKRHGTPRIMMYRCMRDYPPSEIDPEQLVRVMGFFSSFGFAQGAEHPGLYRTFKTAQQFERDVRTDLTKLLIDENPEAKGKHIAYKIVRLLAPQILRLMREPSFGQTLEELRRNGEESEAIRFLFNESLRDVNPDERVVLKSLSIFEGPAAANALTAITQLPRESVKSALEKFTGMGYVEPDDPLQDDASEGRYAMDGLARQLVREEWWRAEAKDEVKEKEELQFRFASYWVGYASIYGAKDYDAYGRLEAEWDNLKGAAELLWGAAKVDPKAGVTGHDDGARKVVELARALRKFLWFCGYWRERIVLSERAYAAASALDNWGEASWQAFRVAWIHYERGDFDAALKYLELGKKAAEGSPAESGRRERAQESDEWMRGLIAWQKKDYAEAERLLGSAYKLLSDSRRAEKDDDIPGVLNSLGEVKREQGRLEEARADFIRAWKISKARGNRQNIADCFEKLGGLCIALGRAGRARRFFERSLACASDLNILSMKAGAIRGLAESWASEGRADVALPLAREALGLYSQLEHKEAASTAALVAALAGGADAETGR